MRGSLMPLSATRVAQLHVAGLLDEALRTLSDLTELDSNLNALESSFDDHYPGVVRVAATGIDPEITSQVQALTKARAGLKAAIEVKRQVEAVMLAYADDKTAARALADAQTMIDRFTRHEEAAAKILRTIGKKQMPPALKAYANKVEKILRPRFVDPSNLLVIPWVTVARTWVPPVDQWSRSSLVDATLFQVVFRVDGVPNQVQDDDSSGTRRVQLTVNESTAGEPGTRIDTSSLGSWSESDTKEGPEWFAAKLLDRLRGWSGLKGEEAASTERKAVATQIGSALLSVVRRLNTISTANPRVDSAGRSVKISFRTNLRSEDYGEYDDTLSIEGGRLYKTPADKALSPFKAHIKSFHLSYEEKGWWTFSVMLK